MYFFVLLKKGISALLILSQSLSAGGGGLKTSSWTIHIFREDAVKAQSAKLETSDGTQGTSKNKTAAATPSQLTAASDQVTSTASTPANKTTSSHLARLTPKQGIVIKEKQATDFFGRAIKVGCNLPHI